MSDFDPSAHLSERLRCMEESAILRMSRLTRELRARGRDIVSLTLGEPDFDTPEVIRKAACAALEAGYTHYPPLPGFPEVRAAIAEKLREENGLDYGAQGVLVTTGAKQALANAVLALVDPGDEVILPAPYWVSYEILVKLAGGVPVVVEANADSGFGLDTERIARVVTERTKLVMINTPCNPSGAVFTREMLAGLADIVRAHPRMMVLSDEIYEYILFDNARHVSIGALPGMLARTVTVNGFSKSHAMTGWRLGYAAADPAIISAMAKMQGAITSGVNAFSQRAAITALEKARPEADRMVADYARRRTLMAELLAGMPGMRLHLPAGTFYMLPDFSDFLTRLPEGLPRNDVALAEWLLVEHGVSTVPGSAFGAPGTLRLSFSVSDADIREGIARLRAGMEALAAWAT